MNPFDAVNAIALIAERKIREAMEEGQFDNLPGRGRPQRLEDLSHLPPEMRPAYLILKNSGHLESEEAGARPTHLAGLLAQSSGGAREGTKLERLRFRLTRRRAAAKPMAAAAEETPDALENLDPAYLDKLLKRF